MSYSDCEAACFAADECAYFSSGNGFVGSSLPPALSSALAVASADCLLRCTVGLARRMYSTLQL